MGYITSFNGEINLKDTKIVGIIRKQLQAQEGVFEGCQATNIYNNTLTIFEEWKNYGNWMERLCLYVAMLDKEAEGEIFCDGEDREDKWKIVIHNGKVQTIRSHIEYDEPVTFEDTETKKLVYQTTKNKELLKEVMAESLDN